MNKVCISVGHTPSHPGYESHGTSEYAEMAIVAGIVVNMLQRKGIEAYLIGTGTLQQKVRQINYIGPDCAVELHLNEAGNCGATGFETLYCPGSNRGKNFAAYIHNKISSVMGSRNRGVKEGWYHMVKDGKPDYFLKETSCPAVITELYFLDSTEADKYVGNYKFYIDSAQAISDGIIYWLER